MYIKECVKLDQKIGMLDPKKSVCQTIYLKNIKESNPSLHIYENNTECVKQKP